MGPRLEGRGNLPPVPLELVHAEKLQWGRVLKDAEMDLRPEPDWWEPWLQWGRVLKDAEIPYR